MSFLLDFFLAAKKDFAVKDDVRGFEDTTDLLFEQVLTWLISEAMEQHRITCEEEGRYVGKWTRLKA